MRLAALRAGIILKRYRQATQVAVAATSLLLILSSGTLYGANENQKSIIQSESEDVGSKTIVEATEFFTDASETFYNFLPKLIVALLILALGWLAHRVIKKLVFNQFKDWGKAEATMALTSVIVALCTLGLAFSALVGDIRALLGSIGLVGLALSWALQAPIESFTGWLFNSFRNYYKKGDRIKVGEVFGDVFKIDILTTTVWQAGGPGQSVQASQPTGALITFPNSDVLRSNIINYTKDFPYVWDEVEVSVANTSDLNYTLDVVQELASQILSPSMSEPARIYKRLLKNRHLPYEVSSLPSVFAFPADSWTQIVVRYLVEARDRRRTSTDVYLAISQELARPKHRGKIFAGYPHTQVETILKKEREVD